MFAAVSVGCPSFKKVRLELHNSKAWDQPEVPRIDCQQRVANLKRSCSD